MALAIMKHIDMITILPQAKMNEDVAKFRGSASRKLAEKFRVSEDSLFSVFRIPECFS